MKVLSGIRAKNTLRMKGRFLERGCFRRHITNPSPVFKSYQFLKKIQRKKNRQEKRINNAFDFHADLYSQVPDELRSHD
jgi:hypothetical protein